MLNEQDISKYNLLGYACAKPLQEVCLRHIKSASLDLLKERGVGWVLEKDQVTVRTVYGCHKLKDSIRDFAMSDEVVSVVERILQDRVYIYQSKLNVKASFTGAAWPWHQDFVFWREFDKMPAPRAVTLMLFLDDVDELNGPMRVLSRSHMGGVVNTPSPKQGYATDTGEDLAFSIPHSTVLELGMQFPEIPLTGPSGSIILFHPNIIHSSSSNTTPRSRNVILITYNAVTNAPNENSLFRPDYLVARHTAPLPHDIPSKVGPKFDDIN